MVLQVVSRHLSADRVSSEPRLSDSLSPALVGCVNELARNMLGPFSPMMSGLPCLLLPLPVADNDYSFWENGTRSPERNLNIFLRVCGNDPQWPELSSLVSSWPARPWLVFYGHSCCLKNISTSLKTGICWALWLDVNFSSLRSYEACWVCFCAKEVRMRLLSSSFY